MAARAFAIVKDSLASDGCGEESAVRTDAANALDFFSYRREALAHLLHERFRLPRFRATQLFDWVYRKGILDFQAMSNVGASARDTLSRAFHFFSARIVARQISNDGTRKYLLELAHGDRVEAVMIKQPTRMTLCLSSQVGCGMGCKFCRTATMGFQRNLSVSEIIAQVRAVLADAVTFGDTFSNIVFMGMGEPLHNLRNVCDAIAILTDEHAFGLGPRKITVSTSGLVPAIKKFGESGSGVNLAVSLNATTDEIRDQIMPVNKAFPLAELLGSLRSYPLKARKRITIEYVMLEGLNTTEQDLRRLPRLLEGIPSKVNLIPYNENAGLGFRAPTRETIERWHKTLNGHGLNATIRWSKGQDIDAACGQLATTERRSSPLADGHVTQ